MSRQEHGGGTVRTVRDRKTKQVLGYQALLPRELSEPPEDCRDHSRYQQAIGPRFDTEPEARTLLTAAILERLKSNTLRHGLPIGHFADSEIRARLHDARREYGNDARANRSVSTWRSIDRVYLAKAPFYGDLPQLVDAAMLQDWIDHLTDQAENQHGDPLSGNFIRNIAQFLKAIFERAKISPNPVLELKLPDKNAPRFTHLEIAAQGQLFGERDVSFADRVMAGCGAGAGLRVGELLSFEVSDVFVSVADPHLIVRYGGDHRAPTKGRRVRRVELFEPGLGFWRVWLERFYKGGQRVFSGEKGGYLKSWPEQFPEWSKFVGKKITSHVMRHSYAVSMLSGSWGYDPQSLEFVQQQLGHADRATTERYYGAFEHGTWQREVRRMTGRETRPAAAKAVTALDLLLRADASIDASSPACIAKSVGSVRSPSLTPRKNSHEAPVGRLVTLWSPNTLEPLGKKRGAEFVGYSIGSEDSDDER